MATTHHTTESAKVPPDHDRLGQLARFVATTGTRGLVTLARIYLGPAAAAAPYETADAKRAASKPTERVAGLEPDELRVLGLALSKLAFEAGELSLRNPQLAADKSIPAWKLDDRGLAPAISLVHVLAAARRFATPAAKSVPQSTEARPTARAMHATARTGYYAARATARPTETSYMPTHDPRYPAVRTASTGACGSCGGSHSTPPPAPPVYDPCAGGIPAGKQITDRCSSGGGGCACGTAQRTRTYDSSECPTFAISCETKLALRDCAREALCEFARCATEVVCPDGRFDRAVFEDRDTRDSLVDCFGQLVCSFLHCVPDALCPPACEPELPALAVCLPCDYAVEVRR